MSLNGCNPDCGITTSGGEGHSRGCKNANPEHPTSTCDECKPAQEPVGGGDG